MIPQIWGSRRANSVDYDKIHFETVKWYFERVGVGAEVERIDLLIHESSWRSDKNESLITKIKITHRHPCLLKTIRSAHRLFELFTQNARHTRY